MDRDDRVLPGIALVAAIAAVAWAAVRWDALRRFGASPLTVALVLGVFLGNACPGLVARPGLRAGVTFAQRRLLRAGVALYGFNLSVQQIVQVGITGVLVDVAMVVSTLLVGGFVGRRLLGMDRETVLLASAGSAICGAAAVVATVPMLRSGQGLASEKSAVAVATVVLFGTLAMLLYPALYAWLGDGVFDFGIYVGSTVHEVAQVVAIGTSLGGDVAGNAVIVKMIRVMLLVPFLLAVGWVLDRRENTGGRRALPIPWFAVMFVALAAVNSLHILPVGLVDALRLAGVLLLTAAMASLGLDTNVGRVCQAGVRPLLLGGALFGHLVLVGGLINWLAA